MLLDSTSVHPYGAFWLDFADKAIKALAVIVAGIWTYINFIRSRTFMKKLEPSVSGKIFEKNGKHYILISKRLKNVGQAKYPIRQKGTALEADTLSPDGRTRLSVTKAFEDHAWIEPGEQIDEPVVLSIPDPASFIAILG